MGQKPCISCPACLWTPWPPVAGSKLTVLGASGVLAGWYHAVQGELPAVAQELASHDLASLLGMHVCPLGECAEYALIKVPTLARHCHDWMRIEMLYGAAHCLTRHICGQPSLQLTGYSSLEDLHFANRLPG